MKIAIASGKGGTGKTTLSVNIALAIGRPLTLLDCDVEEPNSRLFLDTEQLSEEVVNTLIPEIDGDLCNGCGECARFCQFNAIVSFGTKPLVFAEMCHGCGGCAKVCPQNAIKEVENRIGVITGYKSGDVTLYQGCIDVGVSMAPPMIRELKKKMSESELVILDAPPGTTCPVVATLSEVDYVLLVTEPTPFGLNDLVLAVAMVRELGLPFGVVINRVGVGDDRVHKYCAEENIPVLLEIPNDRAVAEAYSRGESLVDNVPGYREIFAGVLPRIEQEYERWAQ